MTALKATRIQFSRPERVPPPPDPMPETPKKNAPKPVKVRESIQPRSLDKALRRMEKEAVVDTPPIITDQMKADGEEAYEKVCRIFNLDAADWREWVMSDGRHPNVVKIRALWALRLCVWYGYSQPETAAIIGRSGHAMVNAAIERISKCALSSKYAMRIMGLEWPEEGNP